MLLQSIEQFEVEGFIESEVVLIPTTGNPNNNTS
jgi:hypothetical protein